ncbi:hypothetical protein DFS34DRAFT_633877 [Phlyctochytrium arcticum]|nr:hypothetical protein DFS34DRAFT_633877 [Phlyctochytrium arcticum]
MLDQLPPANTLTHAHIGQVRRLAPRGSGWTVWLSKDLREKFREKKELLAGFGHLTHGEFVELLLQIKEGKLDSLVVPAPSPRQESVLQPVPKDERIAHSHITTFMRSLFPGLSRPETVPSPDILSAAAEKALMQQLLQGPLPPRAHEQEPLPPYRDAKQLSARAFCKSAIVPEAVSNTTTVNMHVHVPRPSLPISFSSPLYRSSVPTMSDGLAPPYKPVPQGVSDIAEPLPPYFDEKRSRLFPTALQAALQQNLMTDLSVANDALLSYAASEAVNKDEDSQPKSPSPSWSFESLNGLHTADDQSAPVPDVYSSNTIDEPLPSYEFSVAARDSKHDRKAKGAADWWDERESDVKSEMSEEGNHMTDSWLMHEYLTMDNMSVSSRSSLDKHMTPETHESYLMDVDLVIDHDHEPSTDGLGTLTGVSLQGDSDEPCSLSWTDGTEPLLSRDPLS